MASLNKNLNNFFNNNKFLGSFQSFKDIPYSDIKKECCFIGRSNVGKSSLINSLTKTKKLAKTSKTPGRTQAINVFLISEKINMIDLELNSSKDLKREGKSFYWASFFLSKSVFKSLEVYSPIGTTISFPGIVPVLSNCSI